MNLDIHSPLPERKDWRIGCIGSGFIMNDCRLVAYGKAGFDPVYDFIFMPGLPIFSDTACGDIAFGHDLSQSFAYRQSWQPLQQTSTNQCSSYQ